METFLLIAVPVVALLLLAPLMRREIERRKSMTPEELKDDGWDIR